MTTSTSAYVAELNAAWGKLDLEASDFVIQFVADKLSSGSRVFTCGNGGSGATASHFVNDWVKGISLESGLRVRAQCLSDNVPLLTAIANDLDYSEVFSFQLSNLAEPGDLLIVISGSGNSQNILKVLKRAKEIGITTVGVLGFDGGEAINFVDHVFLAPSFDMQIVEDIHSSFGHLVLKLSRSKSDE